MIVLYVLSLFLLLAVAAVFLRRSALGVVVLAIETPFILGLCLYPVLLESGVVSPGHEGVSYLSRNGPPGWIAAWHVFVYAVFALIGYLFASRLPFHRPHGLVRALERVGDPLSLWRLLVIFGLLMYGAFMVLVGPEVALINAFLGRSGDFSGFGDSAKYLFLKTVGSMSMFAVCFIPYVITQRGGRLVFLLLYLALVVVAYLNSISRNLILYQFIVPLLMLVHGLGLTKRSLLIVLFTVLPVAFLAVFFGKPLGFLISIYLSDGNVTDLQAYQGDDGLWNSFLRNFEAYWFSVDAGISVFAREGPTWPTDALMALIGFVPSRMLESLGLPWLYYGNADVQMACVNSAEFGLVSCTVPPFTAGMTAYAAPLLGAAVAAFFKFFLFGRLQKTWQYYQRVAAGNSWIPYFLVLIFAAYLSFIPTSIALASFTLIVLVAWLGFRALLAGALRPSAHADAAMPAGRP